MPLFAQVFLLQGEKGETGDQGQAGKDGAKGEKGEDGKGCSLKSTKDSKGNTILSFTCGTQTLPITVPKPLDGKDGKGCTLTTNTNGKGDTILSFQCGNQSVVPVVVTKPKNGTDGKQGPPGQQGPQGKQGIPGPDGKGCTMSKQTDKSGDYTLSFKCGTQPEVPVAIQKPKDGIDGKQGLPGPKGTPGKDGSSCRVSQAGNTTSFECNSTIKGSSQGTVKALSTTQATLLSSLQSYLHPGPSSLAIGPSASKPTLIIEKGKVTVRHANLHVESGSGKTDGTVNGLGNLIIGYNENTKKSVRTGSHNLIVGMEHGYSSYGGVVFGHNNKSEGPYACVLGGTQNRASGKVSVVAGGSGNAALGENATIVGGKSNNIAKAVKGSTLVGGQSVSVPTTSNACFHTCTKSP